MKKLFTILLLILTFSGYSQIKGKVVSIHDGDTFTFQNDSCKITVRLAYIDAPELTQSFGKESRDYLIKKILNKKVVIVISNKDKYGRYVSEIFYYKKSINENMVSNGWAWVYVDFCKIQHYYTTQDLAKKHKKGLWIDSNAVAPWVYRHSKN